MKFFIDYTGDGVDTNEYGYVSEDGIKLTEVFVDEGYELDSISPKDSLLLTHLRERYLSRKGQPIAFYDLKGSLYKIGNDLKLNISDFQITGILRRLWRYGELRRFIIGKTDYQKRSGRGTSYGIHYILHKNKE